MLFCSENGSVCKQHRKRGLFGPVVNVSSANKYCRDIIEFFRIELQTSSSPSMCVLDTLPRSTMITRLLQV